MVYRVERLAKLERSFRSRGCMKINQWMRAATAAFVFGVASSFAFATDLYVEIPASRSGESDYGKAVEVAVRNATQRMATLTQSRRDLQPSSTEFTLPTRVILTKNGVPLRPNWNIRREALPNINLVFAPSGPTSFPGDYRTQLESTFTAAKSAMDAIFGAAVVGGNVNVINYDAAIPARQAVSGGIYIPNGPNGPEIRFPIYNSPTSASINFIHTLLLAYLADKSYPFDAYNEGLVRAATMLVSRVPGTIPNSTSGEIAQTLESLYDSNEVYHWSNYPGLGAPTFIAPNLLNDPLPAGGSTGGIYLLRYKMSGTAWSKVLVQYPGFIALFNSSYTANPAAYTTEQDLLALGQSTINTLQGSAGATVEGKSFADWARRQAILDVRLNPGLKLVPEAFPFEATPATSDFGVFGIVLNAFRTAPNGNETLLSGTSYPIYWRNDFTRFFTTVQDDFIPVAGGYGAVAPNFPSDGGTNPIYRTAVDLPFQGKNVRLYFPAGAYSTGASSVPKNVYGTVVGYDLAGTGITASITWNNGTVSIPVFNGAFSTHIGDSNFNTSQQITVQLRTSPGNTLLQTILVNKPRGDLALDIRSPGSDAVFSTNLLAKLNTFSIPLEPYRPNPADMLNLADNQTLLARYDPFTGKYDFYPTEGEVGHGLGYFTRLPLNTAVSVAGRTSEKTPLSVSLKPGWNLISVPGETNATKSDIRVTTTTQALSSWAQAADTIISDMVFRFDPDPVNPDLGTLNPATTFVRGEAYFVRSLQSEGAVLVFLNGASASLTMGEQMRRTEAIHGQGNTGILWKSQLELRSTQGHFCQVEIGQAQNASRGYAKEDLLLPAGPGGFQMTVNDQKVGLYRDMRSQKYKDRYEVKITNLRPGVTYTLTNRGLSGNASFALSGIPFSKYWLPTGSSVTFKATNTTMTFFAENQ